MELWLGNNGTSVNKNNNIITPYNSINIVKYSGMEATNDES